MWNCEPCDDIPFFWQFKLISYCQFIYYCRLRSRYVFPIKLSLGHRLLNDASWSMMMASFLIFLCRIFSSVSVVVLSIYALPVRHSIGRIIAKNGIDQSWIITLWNNLLPCTFEGLCVNWEHYVVTIMQEFLSNILVSIFFLFMLYFD